MKPEYDFSKAKRGKFYREGAEIRMSKTFQNRAEAFAYLNQNDPRAPKAGDLAPDFELLDTNGENPVRLSHHCQDKPVALIFGSFT